MNRTYIFALANKDESIVSIKIHGNGNTQLNMFAGIAESLMGIYSPEILHKKIDEAFDEYISGRKNDEDKHNA